MIDPLGRNIDYLRISVTARCNLKCRYCVPDEEIHTAPPKEILSAMEILEIARTAARLGFVKIRITGGEPLLRPDIVSIISEIAQIQGIKNLSLTTNGVFLSRFIKPLVDEGLSRVNVSLDTLDPHHYREITGGGDVKQVLKGIMEAKEAFSSNLMHRTRLAEYIEPGPRIKLNCVVDESSDEPGAASVREFAVKNGFEARFIRKMDISKGKFWIVEGGSGGDCPRCNRLRLTCDGILKPCLFSDLAFDVREHGIEEALRLAIGNKPEKGGPCGNNFLHLGG